MRDEMRSLLGDVAEELKRPEAVEPAFDERVMRAVRRLPVHRRLGLWARAIRPRTLTLRPLPWGAGALVAAAAMLFVVLPAVRRDGRPSDASAPASAAGTHRARGHQVQFVLVAPTARKVAVLGDFNDWDRKGALDASHEGGGVWAVTARIPSGHHRYAFVVDDSLWVPDPAAPRIPDDDFGTPSSALVVGGGF
jgi:hypothetical protein